MLHPHLANHAAPSYLKGFPFSPRPMANVAGSSLVADLRPSTSAGHRVLVLRDSMPAVFHQAVVLANPEEGGGLTIGTGSGADIAHLLNRLAHAFAAGTAQLHVDEDASTLQGSIVPTNEDGAEAELFLTASGWHAVQVEEHTRLYKRTPSTNVYVQDGQLAKDIAAAIADGMLSLEPTTLKQRNSLAALL